MRNIMIVDCRSTGKNFIGDIITRGYNPVVLHLKNADTEAGHEWGENILKGYETIPYDFDMIYESDTFEETLEQVKKFDPLLILPGNERGVRLASKLTHELGLLGNSIEDLDALTYKNEMHNRLAQNGIRSIKGKVVNSIEDAIDFYDSEGLKEVVLKPIYGAGSTSVRICLNRDEFLESAKFLFNNLMNEYGEELSELLIQERINGVEYIVNTVSREGIPSITTIWKYNKVKTSYGANVYDSCETVNELNIGEAELIEYVYKVLKVLGVKYGPVHGEYMIDDKGPVLIEVNCRPMGLNMPAEFLDKISGQHETDTILDAYLKPKIFDERLKKKYGLYAYGNIKSFRVPNDMFASSSPMVLMFNKLKAFHSTSLTEIKFTKRFYSKTVDIDTSGGTVFLVHKNKFEVDKTLEFLRTVENNAFSLILSHHDLPVNTLKDDETYLNDIYPIIKWSYDYTTSCLFITDQFVEDINILQIGFNEIDELKGSFDYIILNLNKSLYNKSEVEKVNILLNIFLKLKTGGMINISKSTYELLASGRKGVEVLLKLLDYNIDVPPYYIQQLIIASKKI